MTREVVILRSSKQDRLRETSVELQGVLGNFPVDPTTEVFRTTGIMFNRYGSIISLAAGITDAGWRVYLQNQGEATQHLFRNNHAIGLPYWLFGICLGRKRLEWTGFKASLDRCKIMRPTDRAKIINDTAHHFFEKRPTQETPLYLILR